MPLLPMGPPQGGGASLPPPPQGMGAPGPLMPPPDAAPAAAGALALAPLAQEQQAVMDQVRQQLAQQALAAAMQAIAGQPNPAAAAAQTEPGPPVSPQGLAQDQATQGGGY